MAGEMVATGLCCCSVQVTGYRVVLLLCAGKILRSTVKYSEIVLTHIADLYDCGTHMYMHCGSIVHKMDECASMVAKRHCRAAEVTLACGYQFNFLELIPRGSYTFPLFLAQTVLCSCFSIRLCLLVESGIVAFDNVDCGESETETLTLTT